MTARPTLKDIAQRTGVSVATVSLALAGRSQVASPTRERVLRMAKELGYRPDPALSALSAYRCKGRRPLTGVGNFAFLFVEDSEEELLNHPFKSQIFAGCKDRVAELGCSLDPISVKQCRGKRLAAILSARGIRGVLLATFPDSAEAIGIDLRQFDCVALYRPKIDSPIPAVVTSPSASCRLFSSKLRESGYVRSGLVVPKLFSENNRFEWEAAFAFIRTRLPQSSDIPVLRIEQTSETNTFFQWARNHHVEVAAILAHFDYIAEIVEVAKHTARPVVPCSFDLPALAGSISGLYQNRHAQGRAAVDMLYSTVILMRAGHTPAPATLEITPAWHVTKSFSRSCNL